VRPRHWYLGLALLGTILPYSRFVPFIREHGFDLPVFLDQLFVNRVSSFFAFDVIVSSLVLWVFVFYEGRRYRVRHLWAPIVANVAVGVSLGLPLFLYMRELRLERGERAERS
jgi:Protein of unknown function DUF2834